MPLGIAIYRFEKMPNSTSRPNTVEPNIQPIKVMPFYLKNPSSVRDMTIVLDIDPASPEAATIPGHANYAAIQNFGRWYHIMDWVSVTERLWEAHLVVDVCGTYRDYIFRSTQFVERAEMDSNGDIVDALAPSQNIITTQIESGGEVWDGLSIVVRSSCSPTLHVFNRGNFIEFLGEVFSEKLIDEYYGGNAWRTEYPQAKLQFNPLQYLSTVKAYPSTLGGNTGATTVDLGWTQVQGNAKTLTMGSLPTIDGSIPVPSHPQGGYHNQPPFSEISLYYPPFGRIPLDAAAAIRGGSVNTHMVIDPGAGIAELTVSVGQPRVVDSVVRANVGADIPLGVAQAGGYGALNAVTAVASAFVHTAKGNFEGTLNDITSTIADVYSAGTPHLTTVGGGGSLVGYSTRPYIQARFQNTLPPPIHFAGRPLYRAVPLSELVGGFCQCRNAEMPNLGTTEETMELERIMNGGFYLE